MDNVTDSILIIFFNLLVFSNLVTFKREITCEWFLLVITYLAMEGAKIDTKYSRVIVKDREITETIRDTIRDTDEIKVQCGTTKINIITIGDELTISTK